MTKEELLGSTYPLSTSGTFTWRRRAKPFSHGGAGLSPFHMAAQG